MEQNNNDLNLNNTLNADKFKLVFRELKGLELLCRSAPIPGVSANPIPVPNKFNQIYVQGDKVSYEPLTVRFRVDRNLISYRQVHKWFTDIHKPQEVQGFLEYQKKDEAIYSKGYKFAVDCTLFSLTNSMNANVEVRFVNTFPINISGIDFDNGNSEHVFSTATFQYDYYEFVESSTVAQGGDPSIKGFQQPF